MITEKIKKATAESHMALEENNLLVRLTQKGISREIYIKILKKFYGYFFPIEQCVDRIAGLSFYLPDYEYRRKSSLLLNDIYRLNDNNSLDLCSNIPEITNVCQAIGALYVLEGSSLGGRLIYKNIQSALGIQVDSGASFFYGYGEETGKKWKEFQKAIIFCEDHFKEEKVIIDTAVDTFSKFNDWMKI